MRASNPTISNPMSRTKKRGSMIPLIAGFSILFLVVSSMFYLTVFQAGGDVVEDRYQRIHFTQSPFDPQRNDPILERQFMRRGGGEAALESALSAYQGELTLHTGMGDIKIVMRSDWSPESVNYIHKLAQGECDRCAFYRAEKPGIFQGIMKAEAVTNPKVKGLCPRGFEDQQQACPEHDPKCACHGPIMRRGFVGWAGGGTGPDFFIDMYEEPAKFWGNTHTAWGKIVDDESFDVITKIFELPVKAGSGGMHFLNEPIKFTMSTNP